MQFTGRGGRRRTRPAGWPGGVLLGAALACVLAGCSGASPPDAVIVLPDVGSANFSVAPQAVQLSVGQVLGVQVRYNDGPDNWQQVSGGSAAVLKPDGEDTITGCKAGYVGCRPTVRERYRAVSAGTTTIEWDVVGVVGSGALPAGVTAAPCPAGYGAGARCVTAAVMKITVTVR